MTRRGGGEGGGGGAGIGNRAATRVVTWVSSYATDGGAPSSPRPSRTKKTTHKHYLTDQILCGASFHALRVFLLSCDVCRPPSRAHRRSLLGSVLVNTPRPLFEYATAQRGLKLHRHFEKFLHASRATLCPASTAGAPAAARNTSCRHCSHIVLIQTIEAQIFLRASQTREGAACLLPTLARAVDLLCHQLRIFSSTPNMPACRAAKYCSAPSTLRESD